MKITCIKSAITKLVEIQHRHHHSRIRQHLKFTLGCALSFFALAEACAFNLFAETPLFLQNKETSTSTYSIKPNITFLIDDSASMNYALSMECQYRRRACVTLNANKLCSRWGTWSAWSGKENKIPGIPVSGTTRDTEDNANDPLEKHIQTEYKDCSNVVDQYGNVIKRIDTVKNVLAGIVDAYRYDFYFNLQLMNRYNTAEGRPAVKPNYSKFYDTEDDLDYQFIKDHILGNAALNIPGITPGGGTNTTQRFNAVARNIVINKLKYRCQKSYIIVLSDGLASSTLPLTDSTSGRKPDSYAYYDGYFDGDTVRKSPTFVNRLQYMSDTLLTKSFGIFSYNQDIINDISTVVAKVSRAEARTTDDAGQPWDSPDPLAHLPGHSERFTQTAQTFTVGAGMGKIGLTNNQKQAIEYLKNGASPKPDYDPVTNPESRYFFNANSSQELLDTFKGIFKNIKINTTTAHADVVMTSPNMGQTGTASNNMLIKAQIETGSWSSQLCFYPQQQAGSDQNSCELQPSFSHRKLVLNDGQQSYLYSNSLDAFSNATFAIPSNEQKNQSEWLNGLLSWYSRSMPDQSIKQKDFVLDYRYRPTSKEGFGNTRNMGIMLDNPIQAIGEIVNDKQKFLITSANDGMVYVFGASDDPNHPYDLKFNYMPIAFERDSVDGTDLISHYYQDLTNNAYGKDLEHPFRYLLNGGFTVVATPKMTNQSQQIFMLSNMGQAGRGAFALNVGGQDLVTGKNIAADNLHNFDWYQQLFLFQTPTGSDNKFGYTIGKPAIAIIRVNRDTNAPRNTYGDHLREAAIINNGFNYPGIENESALYIYDALGVDVGINSYQRIGDSKGTLIRKLVAAKSQGGLSSPVVYDIDDDGVADLVYAGDYGGNLYRFDLRNPDPKKWHVQKVFTADGPITTAPTLFKPAKDNSDSRNPYKVVVVFGTGSDIYQSDLHNKSQQTIYGIYDDYDLGNAFQDDENDEDGQTGIVIDNPVSAADGEVISSSSPPDDNQDENEEAYDLRSIQPRIETRVSKALIDKSQLLEQTMTYEGDTGSLTNLPFSSSKYNGWFFKLNQDGERVVSPVNALLSTGYVVTRSYSRLKTSLPPDPCTMTVRKEGNSVISRLTQFDARSGGALKPDNPLITFKYQNTAFDNSISIDGLFNVMLATNSHYNHLNAGKSGQQKVPGSEAPEATCLKEAPTVYSSDGSELMIKNLPACAISFKSLGWREIKTGYL